MRTRQKAAMAWIRAVEAVGRCPVRPGVLNGRAVYDEARKACGGQEPVAYYRRLAKFMGLHT
jgi:hypothetical protein